MTPDQAIEKYNLRIESRFIPFRESRNKDNKFKSLNWKISIFRGVRKILETDYSCGEAHCPAYKKKWESPYLKKLAIDAEVTYGRIAKKGWGTSVDTSANKKIEPDIRDVICCVVRDADVINYSDFSSWADEYGYDTDSRKAFDTYQECIKFATSLISAVGIGGVVELTEAFSDY